MTWEGVHPPATSARSRGEVAFVLCFMAIASALRLVALDRYPLPLHQDELSDIYDGYCLAETGADRSGESWPILIRGMGPGDYHPGMYAYLAAIPGWLLGFSVAGGRLPAALAGIATVWLVYCTARRLLRPGGGLLALVFVALSPIHIQYSRQAHQGVCLVPFFVIAITYLLLRTLEALERGSLRAGWSWLGLTGLVIGASTNAYAGQKLTALLFAMLGLILVAVVCGIRRRSWRMSTRAGAVFLIAVMIGAAPQLVAAWSQPEEFFARGHTTFYAFEHGPKWWIKRTGFNLAANLSPHYLFASFGEYVLLSVSRLNIVWLPFLYIGLAAVVLRALITRRIRECVVLSAVVFSLLPAVLTEGNPSPMRSSGVWALYPLVAALGVAAIGGCIGFACEAWMQRRGFNLLCGVMSADRTRSLACGAIATALMVACAVDVGRYLKRPDLQGAAAQNHLVRLGESLRGIAADFDRVYIDADGLFAYLYIAAFSGMTPAEFRAAPREGTVSGYGWEYFHRFGRFYFRSADKAAAEWLANGGGERWLVVSSTGETIRFAPAADALTHAR